METVKLTRSGDAPIVFAGELLAENDGSRQLGRDHNRWHELAIYRTEAGRYVARIEYCTQWQGESGHAIATVVQSGADVARVFRDYDPTSHVVGYPLPSHADMPDPYADRRDRLNRDLRSRYAEQLREMLDSDLFAEAADLSLYAPFDAELLRGVTQPFVCPACGGHHFGRDTRKNESGEVEVLTTVRCHDERKVGCKWCGEWTDVDEQQGTP